MPVTVSVEAKTYIIDGKRWTGPPGDILESLNAIAETEDITGDDPFPDGTIAAAAIEIFGGEVVGESVPPLLASVLY